VYVLSFPPPQEHYVEACSTDYDQIVAQTGCSSASDTLECLRTVPFATLKAAQARTMIPDPKFIAKLRAQYYFIIRTTLRLFSTTRYIKASLFGIDPTDHVADQSLVLAWLPRADGTFLSDNPQRLVQQGKVAKIPFVTGKYH
jgi:hypothetical protein